MAGKNTDSMRALHTLDVPDIQRSPGDVAELAHANGQVLNPAVRERALDVLTSTSTMAGTETGAALRRVLENSDRATRTLGLIGYMPLRHLRAMGLTLSRIADDLGVNQHDLTEFMARAPQAKIDAELDAEAYADRKASELLDLMSGENGRRLDKNAIELLKTRANFLLEYNKRLSSKWAQREGREVERMPNLVINIGANEAPQAPSYLSQHGHQVEPGQQDPQDVSDAELVTAEPEPDRQLDPKQDEKPRAAVHWLVDPSVVDPTADPSNT